MDFLSEKKVILNHFEGPWRRYLPKILICMLFSALKIVVVGNAKKIIAKNTTGRVLNIVFIYWRMKDP